MIHYLFIFLSLFFGMAHAQLKPPPNPFANIVGSQSLPGNTPFFVVQPSGSTMSGLPNVPINNLNSLFSTNQNTNDLINAEKVKEKINNVTQKTYEIFKNKMSDYVQRLIPFTLTLFYSLLIFAILVNAFTHLAKGSHFKAFTTDLFMIIIFAGFWDAIITNWVSISDYFSYYFSSIGEKVSDVPVNPPAIVDYTVNYLKNIYDGLTSFDIPKSIMSILLSIPTAYLMISMVAMYIHALLELLIIGKLSIIFLGFAGWSSLDGYAKKPLIYCVSAGIKLMFLHLFFGVVLSIINEVLSDNTIDGMIVAFVVSILISFVATNIPRLVDSFMHSQVGYSGVGALKQAFAGALTDTYRAVQSARRLAKMHRDVNKSHKDARANNQFAKFDFNKHQQTQNGLAFAGAGGASGGAGHNKTVGSSGASTQGGAGKNAQNNQTAKNPANTATIPQKNAKDAEVAASNDNKSLSTNLNQENTQKEADKVQNDESKPQNVINEQSAWQNPHPDLPKDKNKPQKIFSKETLHATFDSAKSAATLTHHLMNSGLNMDQAQRGINQSIQAKNSGRYQQKLQNDWQHISTQQKELWQRMIDGEPPKELSQVQSHVDHAQKMQNDTAYQKEFGDYAGDVSNARTEQSNQEKALSFEDQIAEFEDKRSEIKASMIKEQFLEFEEKNDISRGSK